MKSTVLYKASSLVCVGLILTLSGCGGSSRQGGSNAESSQDFEESKKELTDKVGKVIHSLPPPSLLPFTIRQKGLPFTASLINSLENSEDYELSNSKSAMVLGVYASDVGYLASYGLSDEARQYMEHCQRLSDRMGIATAIDQSVLTRFQENSGNTDSLLAIINSTLERVEDRLEDLDELKLASLALAGSFVEGLYLCTQSLMAVPPDIADRESLSLELLKILANQHIFLLDLKSVLKETERDDIINKFIDDTETLDIFFDALKEYLDRLDEGDYPDLSNPAIRNFTEEVARVREEIVEV